MVSYCLEKSYGESRAPVTGLSHYGLFPLKCVIRVKWENVHFLHRVCLLLLIESAQSPNKRDCISTHISSSGVLWHFRADIGAQWGTLQYCFVDLSNIKQPHVVQSCLKTLLMNKNLETLSSLFLSINVWETHILANNSTLTLKWKNLC